MVLVFVAIALLMLVGFMALAIDVGFVFTAKADLQAAVDAAALAGASGLIFSPDEARARAIDYAAKNPVYGNQVQLDLADIELGAWNSSTRTFTDLSDDDELVANSIRVTGNLTEARGNPLTLFFARAVGADTADVRAQSVAVAGSEVAWDVVILQDVTDSFKQEIDTAVEADRGLLGCIADNAGEHSRVGFAIHTGWGQAITPLWSIEDGYSDLVLILDNVDSCNNPGMPPCSGTDPAAGLQTALDIFSSSGPN
ncbi:pilus assembly protein TadG-related protein, partial [Candidatus Uhrbacteria bacterium]|nr:pilus assembly protein TadG-related protein [Candidatus Uhrbacteria bacterium]